MDSGVGDACLSWVATGPCRDRSLVFVIRLYLVDGPQSGRSVTMHFAVGVRQLPEPAVRRVDVQGLPATGPIAHFDEVAMDQPFDTIGDLAALDHAGVGTPLAARL